MINVANKHECLPLTKLYIYHRLHIWWKKNQLTYDKQSIISNKKGKLSWTPLENTYYHFLTFDLGEVRTINKIATLGRPHTNEYVTEYIIQYSDDGELWRSYVSPGGEVQVTHICFKSLDVKTKAVTLIGCTYT